MERNDIDLSVCVPAYNEERTLRVAVEDLIFTLSPVIKKLEIIIVNDGSRDATFQTALKLSQEYCQVKVIHHWKRMGIGACYRDALAKAQGEYFTWFPADCENSAQEFIQVLDYVGKNCIVTSHHLGHDSRSFLRRSISKSYTWFLNKYFNLGIRYYNGLTTFPVALLRLITLKSEGFGIFAESVIKNVRKHYNLVELVVPLNKRVEGKSKIFTFNSLFKFCKDFIYLIIIKYKL